MRLDNVTVVDFSRLLPGPYATQLLRDAGARVIKVEDTEQGDYARDAPPLSERGVGRIFDAVNRGKESIAVDLTIEDGRALVHRLVADADVVLEGFRPGVGERLGIDYDSLHSVNPDLVYCSLSGYGQSGPWADRPGHDLNYVGLTGLLDMTRADQSESPRISGVPVADMAGGLFAAFAIVGALCSRALGNTDGECLDVSMTDVVFSFTHVFACDALAGADPRPGETLLTGRDPWYDVYETADGRYLTLAAIEPKFWRNFCEEIDREDLVSLHGTVDPAERRALREALAGLFATRSLDTWIDDLTDTGSMVAPVYTPGEAVESDLATGRGLVERPSNAPPRIGFPAITSAPAGSAPTAIPDHGEQTRRVLMELGISGTELDRLEDAGVIRESD